MFKEKRLECSDVDIKELVLVLFEYYKTYSGHYGVSECYLFTKEFNFYITDLIELDENLALDILDKLDFELIYISHTEISEEIDIYADKIRSFKLNKEKKFDELIVYTPYKPIRITLRTEL